ncbi:MULTISPECIES: HYC_CC_PP family protein [Flavobacterium]|uniref:Uncharacterized protein n=1 Tax=Flavobacterium jumunjinense TaxID=998845 RepID=A0ABV5GT11_9FLAO|nr:MULTISPECIES: hypothetical protein [Flavobacterium]
MQFRKSISVLLSTFILISNLGLVFNVHYCKDKIAGISLDINGKEACSETVKSCCAAKKESKECCSNKLVKLEKETDNVLTKSFQLDLIQFCFNTLTEVLENTSKNIFTSKESPSFYCNSNAPPFYKLYCQLVFYA